MGTISWNGMAGRLSAAVERAPVTLVSAEAGSGKTAAVRSWYAECPGEKAWLTVDARANRPGSLWEAVLRELGASDDAGYADLLAVAAGLAEPTVLVLDDLHELTDPNALAELNHLVDQRSPQLKLVLISRGDPELRLPRWRVSGMLADVRAADLALTPAEAVELTLREGVRLTSEQLAYLMTRTRGWAAGVQLAAGALRGCPPAEVDSVLAGFTGARHDVARYVMSEVLGAAPDHVQTFLLRTSVVEELTGPFAEALMEDPSAPALLEQLATDHELLVGPDPDGRTYRYHPLMREAFYHELTSRWPVLGRVQHGRAASWYADRGRWVEAVSHAMLSRDADRITRTLLTALPRLYSADADSLAEAMRLGAIAPDARGLVGPLTAAGLHLHRGDLDAVRGDLTRCREHLPAQSDLRDAVLAVLRVLDLEVAAGRSNPAETVAIAEDARRLLNEAGPVIGPVVTAYKAIVACRLGTALMWMMRPLQAEASLRAALRPALSRDLVHLQALAHAHLAWLHASAGSCQLGEQHAEAALRLSEAWAGQAYLALAHVCLLRADFGRAERHLGHWTGQVTERDGDPLVDLAGMIMDARLHLAHRSHTRAAAVLAEVREKTGRDDIQAPLLLHWLAVVSADAELARHDYPAVGRVAGGEHGAERVRLARAELGLGRVAEAMAIVVSVLAEDPDVATEVRARLVYAIAQHRTRRDTAALAEIDGALRAAEPERLLLPFAELDQCLGILRMYRDLGGAHPQFADMILARDGSPQIPAGLVEQLTDRELMVLRHLPTLRANTEIGESMFVTVNTVKAHLKAIYRKLGVTNRRAAVERARELHLL